MLGHNNSKFKPSNDRIRFGFQRMNDKAKDGLVLSVVWS
jgi:hypothetical protein